MYLISRRTTRLIAHLLESTFRQYHQNYGSGYYSLRPENVYDFFFENEYEAWFCNAARKSADLCTTSTRAFTDFILKIHTGESLAPATQDWTWHQRERLGQELLKNLARDIARLLKKSHDASGIRGQMLQSLELDGYMFQEDVLLAPEEDVLDVKEESGLLQGLYKELQLPNQDTVFHHLTLSEEHYLAKRWDDSISNSRKFLEGVLQEVVASHYLVLQGSAISPEVYSRPARARDYLETSGLLATKEKSALSSLYGLLSETGSHPYMAENEQARLLRHLALTLSQFVLLRLRGFRVSSRP
jgi:hypothetical protein